MTIEACVDLHVEDPYFLKVIAKECFGSAPGDERELLLRASAEIVRARADIKRLDADLYREIGNRDEWEDKATELAEAVGRHLGIEVGEHSSMNCPVQTALEHLQALHNDNRGKKSE